MYACCSSSSGSAHQHTGHSGLSKNSARYAAATCSLHAARALVQVRHINEKRKIEEYYAELARLQGGEVAME